jgi:hypothetical protein
MAELWTEKFFPQNLEEFIGNTDAVQKALLWSKEWNKGRIEKTLFFFWNDWLRENSFSLSFS